MPRPTAMLCIPTQNCPHLIRGLGQGMEGLLVGNYQVKIEDLNNHINRARLLESE